MLTHVLVLIAVSVPCPKFRDTVPVPVFQRLVPVPRFAGPAVQTVELISFGAVWCGPCRGMKTVVSEIERDGVKVYRIDVDEYPTYMRSWKITTVPAIIVLKNGKETARHVGAITAEKLRAIIAPRTEKH